MYLSDSGGWISRLLKSIVASPIVSQQPMEPVEFVRAPDIADTPAGYQPPYQRPQDVAREFLTAPMSTELPYKPDLRTNLPFAAIASPFQYFRD